MKSSHSSTAQLNIQFGISLCKKKKKKETDSLPCGQAKKHSPQKVTLSMLSVVEVYRLLTVVASLVAEHTSFGGHGTQAQEHVLSTCDARA